jgi:hypothetical protein
LKAAVQIRCLMIVIDDGRAFLARWGDQAHALGWTADDLFGLHLAWLLRGRPVVALTEDSAVIEHLNGSRIGYRRQFAVLRGRLRQEIVA